jgi:hypothetical protein
MSSSNSKNLRINKLSIGTFIFLIFGAMGALLINKSQELKAPTAAERAQTARKIININFQKIELPKGLELQSREASGGNDPNIAGWNYTYSYANSDIINDLSNKLQQQDFKQSNKSPKSVELINTILNVHIVAEVNDSNHSVSLNVTELT